MMRIGRYNVSWLLSTRPRVTGYPWWHSVKARTGRFLDGDKGGTLTVFTPRHIRVLTVFVDRVSA